MRQKVLISALYRLFRPLVRILIRNGMSSETAEDVLRQAFVDVAETDFKLPNRKQTDSRISVLTGLPRKKVAKVRGKSLVNVQDQAAKFNRAERVITAWLREPDFLDEKGDPRILKLEGKDSFSDLVERHAGDVPVRAVADELLRIGNIAMLESGELRLLVRGYRPRALSDQMLVLLGNHTADFLSTLDYNLDGSNGDKRHYQGQVTYSHIPEQDVPAFKALSARLSQRLLEDLDRWLAETKANARSDGNETVRLGLGIYHVVVPDSGEEEQ